MKVAVSAQGKTLDARVDPRFGRASCFLVVDCETGKWEAHDNTANLQAMQGAGIQAAQNVAALRPDAVITGNIGPKAFHVLGQAGINVYLTDAGTVADAVEQFQAGSLKPCDQASKPGHWA